MNKEIIIFVSIAFIIFINIIGLINMSKENKNRTREIQKQFKKEDERLAKTFSDLKCNSSESKTINATRYKAEITIPFSVMEEVEASIPDKLASEIVEDMKEEVLKKMKIECCKTVNTEELCFFAEINGILFDGNK